MEIARQLLPSFSEVGYETVAKKDETRGLGISRGSARVLAWTTKVNEKSSAKPCKSKLNEELVRQIW